MRMIMLVWEYRLGMIKRERTLWAPEDSRAPQERVQPVVNPSLVNLARGVGVSAGRATREDETEQVRR